MNKLFGYSITLRFARIIRSCADIICNILTFRNLLLSCNFVLVRREANGVIHFIAKYVLSTFFPLFCCANTSFPRPVLEAWRLDFFFFLFFLLNESFWFSQKKKEKKRLIGRVIIATVFDNLN
jgi:hypothetical protein